VINEWETSTQAEWEAGTLTNVEASTTGNSIKILWYIVDNFASAALAGWARVGNVSGGGGVLTVGGGGVANTRAGKYIVKETGTYRWRAKYDSQVGNPTSGVYFYSIGDPIAGFTGYGISVDSGGYARMYRVNYPSEGSNVLLNIGTISLNTYYTWEITRTDGGVFTVYLNGVSKGSVTDNTYNGSSGNIYFSVWALDGQDTTTVDDIYVADAVAATNATYADTPLCESEIKDTGVAAPNSWGLLEYNATVPSGTAILFETYTSGTNDFSADNDPAGWVEIAGNGQVNSALKRYIKFRCPFTIDNPYVWTTPEIEDVTVEYTTSTAAVNLGSAFSASASVAGTS